MPRNENIGTRFPLLRAYGEQRLAFLDNDAAATATAEDRIRSIWPYITRRVLKFTRKMTPRQRVNFDYEDVISELCLKLVERDDKYDPARGAYLSYAARVIENELEGIRDRAGTIEAPRNHGCRVKAYKKREEAGTLTPRLRKSAQDIERTRGGTSELAIAEETRVLESPVTLLMEREAQEQTAEGLRKALAAIDPVDAEVLTRMAGLLGRDAATSQEIALSMGMTDVDVRAAYLRARGALRRYLLASRSALVPPGCRKTG